MSKVMEYNCTNNFLLTRLQINGLQLYSIYKYYINLLINNTLFNTSLRKDPHIYCNKILPILYRKYIINSLTQYNSLIKINPSVSESSMKDDLLILKLLKIPVTGIKYLSKFIAMATYLPNYLLILVLDSIIFNNKLLSSLPFYVMSWPFRLVSLVAVVVIFCAEFYGMYLGLSISHFWWPVQLGLTFVAFQGVLALMRHGYLTMIAKYSPTKLKSPKQHLQQLWYMLVDVVGLLLTVINIVLVINIGKILDYQYQPNVPYGYLRHSIRLIHKSVLDLVKLFYIKIFFRIFPWRYRHALAEVEQEKDNIFQLVVLLSLLYWLTMLDLLFFVVFGLHCVLHPRRQVYWRKIGASHEKFKVTGKFVIDTLIEIMECLVLLLCLPWKYKYSKQLLTLILDKNNDYSFHYLQETAFVLMLALVKIPSLICQLFLLITVYKYGKIGLLAKERDQKFAADGIKKEQKLFKNKLNAQAAPTQMKEQQQDHKKQVDKTKKQKANKYTRQRRHLEHEYLVFRCFTQLIKQLPFFMLVPFATLLKIWNIKWCKFLVDQRYDLRIELILDYTWKGLVDWGMFLPTLLTILVLGFYDPLKAKIILSGIDKQRRILKALIPATNKNVIEQSLKFYSSNSATMPQILTQNCQQIRKDALFLPLFVATRISLLSLMGCQHPSDSVQLFQYIWMLFYMKRVRRSPYFQEYVAFAKADQAAGMIKNQREMLRFWKFAHKSVRHRYLSKVISFLLPKRRAEKAIANAPIEKNYSAIANHYWHCYNITFSLLGYLLAFIIEIIVTLFGIIVLMPLTLWRMPTFLILFRIHQFKKKMFFKILFPMYRQMLIDIFMIPIRLVTFLLFPRATLAFHFKTCFRYTKNGIEEFQRVQQAKNRFIGKNIFIDGLKLYVLLWKIMFVKVLWVRKRDMNLELKTNNILLRDYVKDFLLTPQDTPTVPQLMKIHDKACPKPITKLKTTSNQAQIKQEQFLESTLTNKNPKLVDINEQGLQITTIITPYFNQAIDDIPYLALMVFLLFTLPWRFYYIKNALFLMRDDNTLRGQFLKLLKLISKDYQCIFLYFVLILSGVKTRRAFQLFYRNFKLNFYVGTLRYSHLKELRKEVREAGEFYYSVLIIAISCIFAPYRIRQIYTTLRNYYKKIRDQQQQLQKNKTLYQTTLKQGKSLQLITTIGNNSLLQVFQFLNARQLTLMTQVSKYMYDTIKERDQVWIEQWQRVYESKYPGFVVKGENGSPSYNAMCVEKFKAENVGAVGEKRSFYQVALREYDQSLFQTTLDLKEELRRVLPVRVFNFMFISMAWNQQEGYGPEDNWPRADDNEQFLALMGIQRRAYIQQPQMQAAMAFLFERPAQFIIIRLNRFYNVDTHRKKKQIVFALFNIFAPICLIFSVIACWSTFWDFDMFFGYKFLAVVYSFPFCYIFILRYRNEARRWISLHPYDIKEDIINYWRAGKRWIREKSIATGQFMRDKAERYIDRPIRWVARKISHYSRLFGRKVKYVSDLFIEKVAKPLYISISHKIIAIYKLITDLFKAFLNTVKKILLFFKKLLTNIYNLLFSIIKSISTLYATCLEQSLRLALSFGNVGELIFTIIAIGLMLSPSIFCYFYYFQRWFIVFSTILSMVLMVTGYKHLNRMKGKVLGTGAAG